MNSSGWMASMWNCPGDRRREIAQVERDDESRPAVDRRRQHVPVVGVGKGQGRDEGLVPGDEAIGDVLSP